MREFVREFEEALETGKGNRQVLSLKKMRLHHRVLAKISFNAYKNIIDCAEVVKVGQG